MHRKLDVSEFHIPVRTDAPEKKVVLGSGAGSYSFNIPRCEPEEADYLADSAPAPSHTEREAEAEENFFRLILTANAETDSLRSAAGI